MLCLDTDLGVLGAGFRSGLPTRAIDFEKSSSQYLDRSNASFGSYDYAKFAISVWVKLESLGSTSQGLFAHRVSGGGSYYNAIYFNASGKLNWDTYDNSTFRNTRTTDVISLSAYTHLYFTYDSSAAAGNRKRIYTNGSEVVAFDLDDIPSGAITNPGGDVRVGFSDGTDTFDGLVYQFAFFSGTNPAVSSVYSAGKVDVGAVLGLKSMLDVNEGVVTSDFSLATPWSNVGGAVASVDIP